ncbi:MAG: PorP/SprF family type IX secretion system membrane protein [Chitinophagaceae bacterium]|nr:PorP/SprF family type IX secretion system membrane protein [Chitinophagaceae bacterium]
MKYRNFLCMMLTLCWSSIKLEAQDPAFSQFFASPLTVNPALTGDITGKWRIVSNYRSQWIGPGNPYTTDTVSVEKKIFQHAADNYVDENARIALGGMMMYDQSMAGALKSNYASFNVSGNIKLASGGGYDVSGARIRHSSKIKMDAAAEQRLGIGLGVIYGNKRVDPNKLTFEEQFTGNGFNTALPTGEAALSNMKPYVSTCAGLMYSYITESVNFDLGVAAFHFNKPRQSFLKDEKQFLAPRYVVHSNFEAWLSDQLILNTNGIYQRQSGASYFSIGGALGYLMPSQEKDVILNAGLWYWSSNAIVPYLGFTYGNFQVGVTYDVTISSLKTAPRTARTFELNLVLRGNKQRSSGIIPSPWR